MTARKILRAMGINFAIGLAAIGTSARAEPALKCELHVTGGGYPNAVFKPNAFIKMAPQGDPSDPLAPRNITDPSKRIADFDEGRLRALLPAQADVTVIKHDRVLDLAVTPENRIKDRLYPSTAQCYGDLVVPLMWGAFPNKDRTVGVIASIIAGDAKLVTRFALFLYRQDQKPLVVKKTVDSPINAGIPDLSSNREKVLATVRQASAKNLDQFIQFASPQLGK
jgi:hypothetical protein